MDDLTGLIGVCSIGRPGLITGKGTQSWGEVWQGIGLDRERSGWCSRAPTIDKELAMNMIQNAVALHKAWEASDTAFTFEEWLEELGERNKR